MDRQDFLYLFGTVIDGQNRYQQIPESCLSCLSMFESLLQSPGGRAMVLL